MNNTIQYKGYVGSVEFSEEDGIFYGKVMGSINYCRKNFIRQQIYAAEDLYKIRTNFF